MECVKYIIEEDVPPTMASVTTASTAFYTLPHILQSQDEMKRHTLLATEQGNLVEVVESGDILRSTRLTSGGVTKLVVHHEFEPQQLYVVVLFSTNRITILSYSNLKVLHERDSVTDMSSEDVQTTGVPQLLLTSLAGDVETIPSVRLLILSNRVEVHEGEEGKREAVEALAKRLKGGMKQAQQLRGQRLAKENYIQRSLVTLQSQLAGRQDTGGTSLMAAISLPDEEREALPPPPPPPKPPSQQPLRVLNVHHKMVHNKWVIGVNVVNEADRCVIHNLQLVLRAAGATKSLTYSSCALKTVRRSSTRPSPHRPTTSAGTKEQIQVTIEALDPPVLRPGKRTCVLATCELPSFEMGSSVTYSGLVTYNCRSLRIQATQALVPEEKSDMVMQASVGDVELRADELEEHQVALDHNPVSGGVSFSCVALVAGSHTSQISLSTLNSPLTDFITRIRDRHSLIKVYGVSDFYCLYPSQPHPLRHAAFTLYLPDAHRANLTLYTKDEKQALLMIQSLLVALPCDTTVQPATDNQTGGEDVEKLRHKLLRKMNEVVSHVVEGCETRIKEQRTKKRKKEVGDNKVSFDASKRESDNPRDRRLARQLEANQRAAEFTREQEELEMREGEVVLEAEEYRVWRQQLHDIQLGMDKLYTKYLTLSFST
ncbi:hypothetical protein Pmani_030733 [Petrolisthes manimaculis]|uniref:Uncharacterized protein n=1 Tax=Petrolisthes manimaculis TaxID=1843537 RepID=A0AAE1TTA6_9EUCA|nr:hypothetical protein Pmani_030733 [Petrolisthes manimaculis]